MSLLISPPLCWIPCTARSPVSTLPCFLLFCFVLSACFFLTWAIAHTASLLRTFFACFSHLMPTYFSSFSTNVVLRKIPLTSQTRLDSPLLVYIASFMLLFQSTYQIFCLILKQFEFILVLSLVLLKDRFWSLLLITETTLPDNKWGSH